MTPPILALGLLVVGQVSATSETGAVWNRAEPQLWWTVGSGWADALEFGVGFSRRRQFTATYHNDAQRMLTDGPQDDVLLDGGYIKANLQRGTWVVGSFQLRFGEGLAVDTGGGSGLSTASFLRAYPRRGRLRRANDLLGIAAHGWLKWGSYTAHGYAFASRTRRDLYQGFLRTSCGNECQTSRVYLKENIDTSYDYEFYARVLREDALGAAMVLEGDAWRVGAVAYGGEAQLTVAALRLNDSSPYPEDGILGAMGLFGRWKPSWGSLRAEWARSHGGGQSAILRTRANLGTTRVVATGRWQQLGFRHPLGAGRLARDRLEGDVAFLVPLLHQTRLRLEARARRRLLRTDAGELPLLGMSGAVTFLQRWSYGLATVVGATYDDADVRVSGRGESYSRGNPSSLGSLEACYLSPSCGSGLGRGERWDVRGALRWGGRHGHASLEYRFRAEDVSDLMSRFARAHEIRLRGGMGAGASVSVGGDVRFTHAEEAMAFRRPSLRLSALIKGHGDRVGGRLRCGADLGSAPTGSALFCEMQLRAQWRSARTH